MTRDIHVIDKLYGSSEMYGQADENIIIVLSLPSAHIKTC